MPIGNGNEIFPKLTPEEAATQVRHGMTVAFSGFAQAGAAKAVPRAIAARAIIERCSHPAYRDYLHRYLERSRTGHIRHDPATAFDMHVNLLEQGAMLPDLDLSTIEDH